ncbi:MAG: YidC/Oxa1 family membrane protein insertase, partial [Miltoncostaeaceae bacterium]
MNPLQLIEDPLRWLLDFLHDNAALSYGWAIVVLTVLVRTALLPLVIKQYRSMRQMQVVAPQLKEIQRKHKGDRAKTQEELMKFYRENEINPFASCLPLLAQLPIFIALFYVLRDFSEDAASGAIGEQSLSFMWLISDVSIDFQELGWGFVIPLLLIYGLTQLLSTELSATPNMPESQRKLMRLLPLFIVIFVVNFPVPAGLVLYWMATNLWTCGQQLVMRHKIGMHLAEIPPAVSTGKRSSRTPPKSGGVPAGSTALVEGEPVEAPDADEAPDAGEA